MKYQTEYQRNFQRRALQKSDQHATEERKLSQVPVKRSSSLSPTRPRAQSAIGPTAQRNGSNFAVIGPNEKFANSQLYRLRQPVEDRQRQPKPKEYAILGRNEKFQDNVVYPLRKPIIDEAPTVERRRQKSESHSCGIQTELQKAPQVSFDPRFGREVVPVRNRLGPQSEYQQQFHWKQSVGDLASDQMLVEDAKVRDRRSDPILPLTVIDPSEKMLIEKNAPILRAAARLDGDVDRSRSLGPVPVANPPVAIAPTKKEAVSEYQSRYKPIDDQKKPRTRKAFEAEQADERKRKEIAFAERAHTDDEVGPDQVQLGKEFRQKHPHTNLRRWKSEYQTTYKPFWRFDYKNGKWYKDTEAEQSGFNPNLFWYKELMATRQQANEYRANAQADHFNREHTLQLQTGQGAAKNLLAWDTRDDDDDTISVHSADRTAERERQREIEAKRLNDERIQSRIHYDRQKQNEIPMPAKTDQTAQTDYQVNRTIYIDDLRQRHPSMATRALVRNLDSTSVQQHMAWDSESLSTARTNPEADFKSQTARELYQKHYKKEQSIEPSQVTRTATTNQQETRPATTQASLDHDRPQTSHGYPSYTTERFVPSNASELRHAAGRSSYDTHTLDKRAPIRPSSTTNGYRSHQNEVADEHSESRTPVTRLSFQNHLESLNQRYNGAADTRHRDDDVLSVSSARTLSSSCSLASKTFELAEQNRKKYWGDK